MTGRAPELRSLGLAIPRALDEVIQRLLRKDPRDRYQSAEAVLLDLADIAAAVADGQLRADVCDRFPRPPPHADRSGLRRPSAGNPATRRASGTCPRRRRIAGACGERIGRRQDAASDRVGPALRAAGNVGLPRPGPGPGRPAPVRGARWHRQSTERQPPAPSRKRSPPSRVAWATTATPPSPPCPNWPACWAGRA